MCQGLGEIDNEPLPARRPTETMLTRMGFMAIGMFMVVDPDTETVSPGREPCSLSNSTDTPSTLALTNASLPKPVEVAS